jgi:GT2 family glycosyltransferase
MNFQSSDTPLVSVVVPCYNEVDFIENFLIELNEQTYKNIQIIIADGDSDDGTKQVLNKLKKEYKNLYIVENKNRIVSTGLNLAIKKSIGSIIVRFDVHTNYDKCYISEAVKLILTNNYDCVGGAWDIFLPNNNIGRGIALSFKSYFGSGGARSRSNDYSGKVDTVYLGAWKREIFDKLGFFDEMLVRNQDDEFCHRIILNQGIIYQSSSIKSTYFGRDSFSKLKNQFYQYGYWKPFVILKHMSVASLRHLAPSFLVLFYLTLLCLAFLDILFLFVGIVIKFTYLLIILTSLRYQFRDEKLSTIIIATFAVMVNHFSYGIGFIMGLLFRTIFKNRKPLSRYKISR